MFRRDNPTIHHRRSSATRLSSLCASRFSNRRFFPASTALAPRFLCLPSLRFVPLRDAFGFSFGRFWNEGHSLDTDAIRPFKKPVVGNVATLLLPETQDPLRTKRKVLRYVSATRLVSHMARSVNRRSPAPWVEPGLRHAGDNRRLCGVTECAWFPGQNSIWAFAAAYLGTIRDRAACRAKNRWAQ